MTTKKPSKEDIPVAIAIGRISLDSPAAAKGISRGPVERMIDAAVSCTICGTPMLEGCSCWEKCYDCGCFFERGTQCPKLDCDASDYVQYRGKTHMKGLPGLTACADYPDTRFAGMIKSTQEAFDGPKGCAKCKAAV